MMVNPFNFLEPIELLFSNLEYGQWYATDGRDLYTLIQLINMALQQIIQGQRYTLDIHNYM